MLPKRCLEALCMTCFRHAGFRVHAVLVASYDESLLHSFQSRDGFGHMPFQPQHGVSQGLGMTLPNYSACN